MNYDRPYLCFNCFWNSDIWIIQFFLHHILECNVGCIWILAIHVKLRFIFCAIIPFHTGSFANDSAFDGNHSYLNFCSIFYNPYSTTHNWNSQKGSNSMRNFGINSDKLPDLHFNSTSFLSNYQDQWSWRKLENGDCIA